MKIPNFRSGLDLDKVKRLYDTLSKIVVINEKEYSIQLNVPNDVLDVLCDYEVFDRYSLPCEVVFHFDCDGGLLSCFIDDDEIFVGG